MRVKRPRHLWIGFQDKQLVHLDELLKGSIEVTLDVEIQVVAPAAGFAAHNLSNDEWELLRKLPAAHWCDLDEIGPGGSDSEPNREGIALLAERGIVLIDDGDDGSERWRAIREADDAITANQWSGVAALFHAHCDTRPSHDRDPGGQDIEIIAARTESAYEDFVAKVGPPPAAFFRVEKAEARHRLPEADGQGDFFRLLDQRRTCRNFDRTRALPAADLALILRTVAGAQGTTKLTDDVTLLRKNSPSGGSLHPIEVYPIILDVEGFEPGLYHYDCRDHELARIRARPRPQLEDDVVAFLANQSYARNAHVLLVFVARFRRIFWKYRYSTRAYTVLAMDVGHLSQTAYLLCAQMGLGVFFSAAIDARAISESLKLQPFVDGPMGVCGIGVQDPAADGGALHHDLHQRPKIS